LRYLPEFDFADVISALSLALDLAEKKQLQHARRVTYVAMRLAERVGLPPDDLKKIYLAGMLHDIGITGHFEEVETSPESELVRRHPLKGKEIVDQLPHCAGTGDIIACHHERWDGNGYPGGLRGPEIPLPSRIIFLADRFEVEFHNRGTLLDAETLLARWLGDKASTLFDPQLCEVLSSLMREMEFILDFSSPYLASIIERRRPSYVTTLDQQELEKVGLAFAELIDNKSPFTANHSQGVAALATFIAAEMGFPTDLGSRIRIAGLLHDLGKMAVPTSLLDKPARLTPEEFRVIKTHPYYTRLILGHIRGLEEMATVASMHHEKLDGGGYPAGLRAPELPLEARIIAVADMYEALTAHRPYRQGLSSREALGLLEKECRANRIDPAPVEALRRL